MKKINAVLILMFIASLSIAQVQRKAGTANKTDSAGSTAAVNKKAGGNKKEMLRDLNLTKDQKSKLKEARQSAKAKKVAIESDNKLSATEKTARLNELKKEQAKNTMGILNDEQKEKMKKMRKDKKGSKMDEMAEE